MKKGTPREAPWEQKCTSTIYILDMASLEPGRQQHLGEGQPGVEGEDVGSVSHHELGVRAGVVAETAVSRHEDSVTDLAI